VHDTKETISRVLKTFAAALDSMDERQFDLLIRGEGNLRFAAVSRNGKRPAVDAQLGNEVNEVAAKLKEAESREAAERLLASIDHPKRRDFLVLVAEATGVVLGSKDTIKRIEKKLVETVVGSKLRSKAFKEVAF
jgi:hypothetical protein